MNGVEVDLDEYGRVEVVNDTGIEVSAEDLKAAFGAAGPMVAQISKWTRDVGRANKRRGGLIDRDRFLAPNNVFEQIRTARQARTDDVVDGISDLTESLAFKRTSFYAEDEDEQATWNLWAETVNLDWLLRAAWRQHFTDSQVVFAMWWDDVAYKIPGKTENDRARRREVRINAPTSIAVLDTLKVCPVGQLLFGKERLAYIATRAEADVFDELLAAENFREGRLPSGAPVPKGPGALPTARTHRFRTFGDDITLDDPVVHRLVLRRYVPEHDEAMQLMGDGVDVHNLYLLDDQAVFRHTATKPDYQRFADVRMRSAFELLDMKQLARQKDRVFLLGGISFLVLITQGSDQHQAQPAELAHLRANAQTIAQVPILVGDHRLDVKIVTPALDTVLQGEKWDVLDERLAARLLRQFSPKGKGDKSDKDAAQLAGHWLENERLMLRRTFERYLFARMVRRNQRVLTSIPKMRFHPARVALAFDQAWASFLMDLRENSELSRETMLSQFEMDQEHEARMLRREAERYDDTFNTHVPFDSRPAEQQPGGRRRRTTVEDEPDPDLRRSAQRRAGRRQGGVKNGGGAAPGSGQGQPPRRPRRLADGATRDELLEAGKEYGIKGRHRMRNEDLDTAVAEAYEAALAAFDEEDGDE